MAEMIAVISAMKTNAVSFSNSDTFTFFDKIVLLLNFSFSI